MTAGPVQYGRMTGIAGNVATTYRLIDSPLGRIRLIGHDDVLTGLHLADHERCPPPERRVGGRRAGLRARPPAARRVLRRHSQGVLGRHRPAGQPLPGRGLDRAARHSLRCHRELPRHRPDGRAAGRGSGRRRRQRPQPDLHHRSLPPSHRRRRRPHRLRLGRRPQGLAAGPRARPQYHPVLGVSCDGRRGRCRAGRVGALSLAGDGDRPGHDDRWVHFAPWARFWRYLAANRAQSHRTRPGWWVVGRLRSRRRGGGPDRAVGTAGRRGVGPGDPELGRAAVRAGPPGSSGALLDPPQVSSPG